MKQITAIAILVCFTQCTSYDLLLINGSVYDG